MEGEEGKERKRKPQQQKERQPGPQLLWDGELHSEFSESGVRHVI